jgi:hypothetical protein
MILCKILIKRLNLNLAFEKIKILQRTVQEFKGIISILLYTNNQ